MGKTHSVAVIKGDLNGITVTDAALEVAEAAKPLLSRPIEHEFLPYGVDYFLEK